MSKAINIASIRTAFQLIALALAELGSAKLKLFNKLEDEFSFNLVNYSSDRSFIHYFSNNCCEILA